MHIPVLLDKVIKYLSPHDSQVFLDATFGAGGYSRAILQQADCELYSLDRDPTVLPSVQKLEKEYPGRFHFIRGDFGNLATHVRSVTDKLFDGIVFDLGVSSMQIDTPDRGFSFYKDGPLDMRMDASQGLTAETVVNEYTEEDLANIFWRYGDEKKSRLIAKKIVTRRKEEKFTRTLDLANLISGILGHKSSIHPATRVFQALRIEVNDELNQLQKALIQAKSMLWGRGVLVVVTFHSGEDGIVKKYFNELCGRVPSHNRHSPLVLEAEQAGAEFEFVYKGVVIPSAAEVSENHRSRSAKLRIIRKI